MAFRGTLIASGNNAKTIKGDDKYETAIMYLAPHKASGMGNTCSMAAVAGCIAGCLNTAGRGAFNNVQQARINKTIRYFSDRAKFMADLVIDIEKFEAYCNKTDVMPAIRLNGTSDIQFEVAHPCFRNGIRYANIFEAFPNIQFYDYTKIYKRARRELPSNYKLTLSYSASNLAYAQAIIDTANETGVNIAIVFRDKNIGTRYSNNLGLNRPVLDGDKDDLRFLDAPCSIVGLYAKGKARKDTSGFVIG